MYEEKLKNGLNGEKKFAQFFHQGKLSDKLPRGILKNCTKTIGCGFDFKIETNNGDCFIEVKSNYHNNGTLHISEREWEVAKSLKDKYFIVIFKNIKGIPNLEVIKDPYSKLKKFVKAQYTLPTKKIRELKLV